MKTAFFIANLKYKNNSNRIRGPPYKIIIHFLNYYISGYYCHIFNFPFTYKILLFLCESYSTNAATYWHMRVIVELKNSLYVFLETSIHMQQIYRCHPRRPYHILVIHPRAMYCFIYFYFNPLLRGSYSDLRVFFWVVQMFIIHTSFFRVCVCVYTPKNVQKQTYLCSNAEQEQCQILFNRCGKRASDLKPKSLLRLTANIRVVFSGDIRAHFYLFCANISK